MTWKAAVASIAAACAGVGAANAGSASPDASEAAFRALYKELIEINTTRSVGDCTRAAEAMRQRLLAAGYPAEDMQILAPPEAPKDGALIAVLRGSDRSLKPILLLAHIDVVEAKREDWVRDPFKLVEEDGWFYARGASDDKSMAAIFTDSLIRYRKEGYTPRRDIKLALTCGEETSNRINGVDYLLRNHRPLIDAGFALNEGAGGVLSEDGRPIALQLQAGEKIHQVYHLEITNPGGHSSRPVPDNAIYRLGAALARVAAAQAVRQVAAAPAVAGFVGAGGFQEALAMTREMSRITAARNPKWTIPALDFAGTPTGIDVRRVVDTGIAPAINTGIAHRKAGIGQVGAGVARAPLACFRKALAFLS